MNAGKPLHVQCQPHEGRFRSTPAPTARVSHAVPCSTRGGLAHVSSGATLCLHHRNLVAGEHRVPRDHGQTLDPGLRDEEAVERISVMRRESTDLQHMCKRYGKRLGRKLAFQFSADVLHTSVEDDPSEGRLDHELPRAHDAESKLLGTDDGIPGSTRKRVRLGDRAERGVCVEIV